MPGRILLDTSVLVGLLRSDSHIEDRLSEADESFTSVVAMAELHYGVRRSSRPQEARERLATLVEKLPSLNCTRVTAEVYGRLKDDLRKKGRPIPDNDLWIASTAVQHGLQLAARDTHSSEIGELQLLKW